MSEVFRGLINANGWISCGRFSQFANDRRAHAAVNMGKFRGFVRQTTDMPCNCNIGSACRLSSTAKSPSKHCRQANAGDILTAYGSMCRGAIDHASGFYPHTVYLACTHLLGCSLPGRSLHEEPDFDRVRSRCCHVAGLSGNSSCTRVTPIVRQVVQRQQSEMVACFFWNQWIEE